MTKTHLLKRKTATWIFAALAFIVGFFLLNKGATGNVIVTEAGSTDIVSIIGLVLIVCALVVGLYSSKQ